MISETMSISRVQLVQELSTLKLIPKSHTTSNWGILGLHGNIKIYPFKCNWSHVQIHLESTGIIETIGCLLVLHPWVLAPPYTLYNQ
jgi:hypothetical protein